MSEELQQKLRSQLWTVANTLRGNMSASDFMYFTLGFIFYKYLSEKIELYANEELKEDDLTFREAWAGTDEDLKADLKEACVQDLGYFVEPEPFGILSALIFPLTNLLNSSLFNLIISSPNLILIVHYYSYLFQFLLYL